MQADCEMGDFLYSGLMLLVLGQELDRLALEPHGKSPIPLVGLPLMQALGLVSVEDLVLQCTNLHAAVLTDACEWSQGQRLHN